MTGTPQAPTADEIKKLHENDRVPERVIRMLESQAAEIARLQGELAEARKDAERWRWLRANICIGSGAGGYDRWDIDLPDPGTGLSTDQVFEAAIDAAIVASATERGEEGK